MSGLGAWMIGGMIFYLGVLLGLVYDRLGDILEELRKTTTTEEEE